MAGEWESDRGGLDTAYSHAREEVLGTPYRERCSMKPFGPVDNGNQHLYGLDYKSAMWRGDEENPFHTEVGYWLWDAATGEIVKGFVVPRGITTLAGGTATADATEFTLKAAWATSCTASGRTSTWPATPAPSATRSPSPSVGQLVLRRVDHAQDGRARRAAGPHRPQHPPPGRLNGPLGSRGDPGQGGGGVKPGPAASSSSAAMRNSRRSRERAR